MKNALVTIALILGVGAFSFGAFYLTNRDTELEAAVEQGDAMVWLRSEFGLDAAQYAAVKKLHEDYQQVCGEHCMAIMAARKRRAPAAEIASLEEVCVRSMTEHFQRVAGLMSPPQGKRYLETVLPRVETYDHSAAPNVQVRP